MIKIYIAEQIFVYLPGSIILGGFIYDKELGGIGLKSSAMLCFLNMGVNCSYLQRNIFSHVSIHFNENIYYTLKKLKQ